jgi:hypothetical protein
MDTKDKTAPMPAIEEELSTEEKAMHAKEAKRLERLKNATPDSDLPQVQSEQSTI